MATFRTILVLFVGFSIKFVDWAFRPLNRETVYTGLEGWVGWFLRYPLLFAQIGLYLGIAWGLVGAELGLTDLYWNDDGWSQFWGGFATGWLFGAVIFVNYLLNIPKALPGTPQSGTKLIGGASLFPSPNPGVYCVGRWMLAWLLGLLVVLYAVKVALVAFADGPTAKNWAEFPYGGGLLIVGYFVSIGTAYLLTALDSFLHVREDIGRADWFQARFAQQDFNVPAIPPGAPRPAPDVTDLVAGERKVTVLSTEHLRRQLEREMRLFREELAPQFEETIKNKLAALQVAGTAGRRSSGGDGTPAERTPEEVDRVWEETVPAELRDKTWAAIEAKRNPYFRAAFANLEAIRQLHASAIVLGVVTLVVLSGVFIYTAFDVASPAIILSLLLIAADVIGGLIAFRVRSVRTLGLLFVGGLLFLNSQCPVRHKMTFPNIDDDRYARGKELKLGCTDSYQRQVRELPDGGLIGTKAWLQTFHANNPRPDGSPPKLVVLAVSGGGIRSAVWTGLVLEGLEERFAGGNNTPAIRKNLRLLAGASGGMVGAAAYAGDFGAGPLDTGYYGHTGLGPFSQRLAWDSLTPVVQTMMLRDFLWNPLVPKSFTTDRGRTLEDAWDDNFDNWRGRGKGRDGASPFRKAVRDPALLAAERACTAPSLIFTPMMVEDSKRLLISNHDLKALTEPQTYRLDAKSGPGAAPLALPGVEFFRLFPEATDFRLGTAARMSATFPIVSPAVNLPTEPIRRVVDAGYFDNYGLDVIVHWLLQNKDAVMEHTSGVLIIQVRAYPLEDAGAQFGATPQSPISTLVASVSAPMEALFTARGSAAYHRNNQLLSAANAVFNAPPQPENFLATTVFELDGTAALSWYLTQAQQRDIARGFYKLSLPTNQGGTDYNGEIQERKVRPEIDAKLNAIRDWLTSMTLAPPPRPRP
ncbi:patatin-like phospholipase family protein [Frigoriglobus tundricola]|uniref:PNPLA domain-containing protein n=1 Tax=Frigoriglobus tundricola TaxID=2774151 RepID=A0A6M5Z1U3_9BACT|nr:patatin-like phospholipase family protein [Frigoriglobus tundricola]QJW99706.1 hypothetical protein FTUN_7329 [Frigoriglobus tundricola]